MTLQQLEYIVALDRHRHFVKAAEACHVSQPTLSAMIARLEEELDVRIFDRSRHPVQPTPAGENILHQARMVLQHTLQLKEIVSTARNLLTTRFNLGIIPTVAPYIIPSFIGIFGENFPQTEVSILEMRTDEIIRDLKSARLDMGVLATPLMDPDILRSVVLRNISCVCLPFRPQLFKTKTFCRRTPLQHLWVLQEGHCLRNQVFNFCTENSPVEKQVYEAGSIDNLIRIIDINGGYTLIPQLHVPMLTKDQRQHVRPVLSLLLSGKYPW